MTRTETIKLLQLLNAFYAGGGNDPKEQVTAWHLVLQKYDFNDAMQAVIKFAENDTRDYATFPAVGKIVEAIRTEAVNRRKPIKEIQIAVAYGREYGMLTADAKGIISEEMYNEWLNMDAEEFNNRSGELMKSLEVNRWLK